MEEEKDQIGSPYFPQISPNMFETYKAKFWPVEKGILKVFLELCLERWDMNSDEQSREILRCILTSFQVIWIQDQDHNGQTILDRITTTYEEIRGRMKKLSQLMEGWCLTLLPNPFMQSNPSSFHEVQEFLRQVNCNLSGFLDFSIVTSVRKKSKENVYILIKMTDFLIHKFDGLEESKNCIDLLNFVNFASAFCNKAACFTCLCWEKQATDDMNLFAMIHHFIPSAPHVIASYFRISSYPETLHSGFLQEETLQGFVDFFFGYLKITLMDEFLILKDQLTNLFTFINDHPRECAEEEDLIILCSQIYALFREDAYPRLSFNEMKEDLSNNNIILRHFIINIDIINAKLIQHYNICSYSWIGSDAVKMDYFFLSVKRTLIEHIDHDNNDQEWNQILLYVAMELGFLKDSLLWFAMLDEEIKSKLNLVIYSLQGIWGKEEEQKGFLADRLNKILRGILNGEGNIADWHPLAFELQGKIELSKLEISTKLVNGFDWSLRSKPSTSNKILKFLHSILHNLNALVRYKANMILPFRKQIETLQDKLLFMQNIMKLVRNCTHSKEDLSEFILFVHDFAKKAARLTILYWLKEANDKTATEISLILSHTLHTIKPTTPCVARLYFETLKALYLHRSDPLLFGHSATIFVAFLFEDSVTDFKDDFQILQDNVIFLLTFLNDPASGNAEDLICSQIDNTFWEDVYGILPIDDMKRDFSHKKVHLSGFMMKIKTINAMIRKLHCEFPDSSLYDLPKITSPWILDFLIHNLRNLKERMITDQNFVPFVKYKIINIEEELVSMSPFFNYIFELQNELNDTWLQVVNLVHLTERVINSCINSWFVFDHPIWYYMSYLSDTLDRIKAIKTKLEKIKENNMHSVCYLPRSAGVTGTSLKQEWSSKIDEVVVGFDDMARKLMDDLIGEHKPLDIVSIVGMDGLGKTTLARKVSSSVKDHFHALAFYTVSQDHNIRMLLLGILKDLIKVDDEISSMDDDDLAHKLKKCLSRRKYLIVLDDLWSTDVWTKVRRSFPDDKNGSRVMFTTRLKDVANECKMKCSPFEMPFISDVESWELLQKKVFQNGISPPHLSNIGSHIAASCKGLPLAIVVIAGVLATKEESESTWSEIAEKVYSLLSDEGCMKILELSYNHLPKYLKPCILYLGAFPEDKLFRVNRVIQLWIAEGFIPEYETKSVEDVAKEYFEDLVGRSLIIVSSRGSNGEIKTFNVHDMIHKLCQTKCHEGNFFNIGRGISALTSKYDLGYRISDVAVPLTISDGSSSLENTSTLLLFTDMSLQDSSFKKLKLVQVMYLESNSKDYSLVNLSFMTSQVNVRHIEYHLSEYSNVNVWLPASISNLWNIQSLILTARSVSSCVPETLWKMKSLRHVKVRECRLQFSDDDEHEQLDKMISFSRAVLCSGKELEQLLQRLPVVRKLGIDFRPRYNEDNVDTLNFFRKLESLNISAGLLRESKTYLINFPSTLKKLTLEKVHLPWTDISSIAELKCLRVLKLRWNQFKGKPTLEMEDVIFSHLVFFQLYDKNLETWNASTESFPCLEQLVIGCLELEELPSCFGEVSTLKRIAIFAIFDPSTGVEESVGRIGEELTDLGNKVEVTLKSWSYPGRIYGLRQQSGIYDR